MKKIFIYSYFAVAVLLITFLSKFDEMLLTPLTKGEDILNSQPYIMIGDIVWTQPMQGKCKLKYHHTKKNMLWPLMGAYKD